MYKKIFLLEKAVRLPSKEPLGEYNPIESLNMTMQNGKSIAVVSIVGAPPTFSKTMARPGDDDPDPGQELCY